MRRQLVITGFTATTLLLGGCGVLSSLPFIGGGEEEVFVPESVPIAPQAAENFEDPLVAEGEPPPPPEVGDDVADGLIPLADADTVAKLGQTQQGRLDPFSTIPVTINRATAPSTLEENLPAIPQLPQLPSPLIPQIGSFEQPPAAPTLPTPSADFPTSQAPQNLPGSSPQNLPGPEPFAPDLPDLPEPTLAQGLNVTGVVVKNDGTKYAIVETSTGKSTYVREGDFVENGQVLVKRIESRQGGTPRVVFEELGIEVNKSLGEGGATPTAASASTSPAT